MIEGKLRDYLRQLGITVLGKGRTGWLTCRCPFAEWTHAKGTDKRPGFGVKINAHGISSYYCLTCHQHGPFSKMIEALGIRRGESYMELTASAIIDDSADELEAWDSTNIETPKEQVPISWSIYAGMYPLAHEHPQAMAYLASRGISAQVSAKMELHYDPAESRIIVPVYDTRKQLFGFNGRSILPPEQWPKDFRYAKTKDYAGLLKSNNILGAQHIDRTKPIFVVEGLFALLHLYQIGADKFVTPVATMGASLSDRQRDILVSFGVAVYVCFDNDSAGEQGLFGVVDEAGNFSGHGAVDKLKKHVPTFLPLYPPGVDDPDYLTLPDIEAMITHQFTVG